MIYHFLGYLPDRIDYPFYRMTFSQGKAMNKSQWASIVLDKIKPVLMTSGVSYSTMMLQRDFKEL
jgi:hypothetical protein